MIALVAGKGDIVIDVLNFYKNNLYVVAFENISEEKLKNYKNVIWFSKIDIYKVIKFLKEKNINKVFFLGKFDQKLTFKNIAFNFSTIRLLLSLKDKRPEKIFEKIKNILKENGILVTYPQEYIKHALASEEDIIGKFSKKEYENAKYGHKIAKFLATNDIGQTVVLKDKVVLALEAIEGTDETILRAGKLVKTGGLMVCKAAREHQTWEFDIPAVGLKTLETMKKAKANTLVLEKNKVLIINKESFKRACKENKIKLLVLDISS